MTTQQIALSLVLATMVFSVALELRLRDFRRVAAMPRAVVAGLIPQFLLLPVGTWLATPNTDARPGRFGARKAVAVVYAAARRIWPPPVAYRGIS